MAASSDGHQMGGGGVKRGLKGYEVFVPFSPYYCHCFQPTLKLRGKAKLEFIEIESNKKMELEKIQMPKELEIAEVMLNAIMKVEEEELFFSRSGSSSSHEGKTQFMEEYVNHTV